METSMVVLVATQGDFGGHFIQGQRWDGTWILS
jgi:hypothetical protein